MHVVFEAPAEEKEPRRRNRGWKRKTYSFGFELISYILAPTVVANGDKVKRPVFLVAAASDEEYAPIRANLQLGRKFGRVGSRDTWEEVFELQRSQPYTFETQKVDGATILTLYHEASLPDPGWVDPEGIQFVCLPTVAWCAKVRATITPEQAARLEALAVRVFPEVNQHYHTAKLIEVAPLFAAFLDRRTRVPLVPDLSFQVALLAVCLRQELAATPESRYVVAKGTDKVGHYWPIMMDSDHPSFNELAAQVAQNYYAGKL